ncbi:MAG: hypothetical protein ACYS21_20955, partial [Planctomycetota bacterium]
AQNDPWQKLNLSSTNIAGATVHYEKCFEPNLPFFQGAYKGFLEQKSEVNPLLSRKEKIVEEVNLLLGIEDPNTKAQHRMLAEMSSNLGDIFSKSKPTFYLVTKKTTKDFLRAGGKLPSYKYDKAADLAEYRFELRATNEERSMEGIEVSFPLSGTEEFEEEVTHIFSMFKQVFTGEEAGRMGLAVHEVVELTLVNRVKPQGPYWRWFSDGFANAISVEILEKQLGEQHAQQYSDMLDFSEYEDLEKQINLKYWMAAQYCVFPLGPPIDYEQRLVSARYAYAMLEAQRLIEKHGIDCVHKILDELCGAESRTGADIISAIFNAASKDNDYEQMLINLLRLMELHEFQYSPNNLQSWRTAAWLLFTMGFEKTGDEVMQNCISLFEHSPVPGGREAAMEAFIVYAFKCGKPEKAREVAPELLKTQPESVLALTVEMLTKVRSGEIIEARQMAKKIRALTKSKETVSYKAAAQVLAIEPNQP